ncbi:hypothetical protein SPRG_08248 [Saprolegnia parasitica CBS 223.65]|uniref:Uncharacterized protein n=1 Tax=Saprolegnia parasitica (strain CBS 223.65) TaxID=695850 RepID=A0A067CB80_SAPPC|nr:hypothetical protein SPRG_08248 [Saprolegnia parasitica CBS 223.65]KDO26445.1 hypothetical protein SPRG_08248 [Saprolegnia parasitica CBS 223.65]|eukprot:XP_012202881.1 hypothetical protein SPRG_08248 [Saprolegnia parasitica CBS 223.65]
MVAPSSSGVIFSGFNLSSLLTGGFHHSHAAPSGGPAAPSGGHKKSPVTKRVWLRIASNLLAASVLLSSLVTMLVLLAEGMFDRRVVQFNYQNDAGYWRPFQQSCRLNAQGFVPHSCSDDERAVLNTVDAWSALGIELALALQVPSTDVYFVTTCLVGCLDETQSAELHLLVGRNAFPACKPVEEQSVLGMVMVEAAVVDDVFPDGAFLATIFADIAARESVTYINSDGTTNVVLDSPTRVLVGLDGTTEMSPDGLNSIIFSYPLGARYFVQSRCISQIVDISLLLEDQAGYSVGETSGRAIVSGWVCGHNVSNATELVMLQSAAAMASFGGIAADLYITIKGLRGLLRHKPVLTYDILSGLERRKMLLLLIVLSGVPSLLYVDVARIYYGTDNGGRIWVLSILSLGIFIAFTAYLGIVLLQLVPSPRHLLHHRLLPFSTSVLIYASIPSIVLTVYGSHEFLSNSFYDVSGVLLMHIGGNECACGAYDTTGVETATAYLLGSIAWAVGGCAVASVLYAILSSYLRSQIWYLRTEWAKDNAFMRACGLPHWCSGLPLDEADAIRIGSRLFCKPSMQARMGFGTLLPSAPKARAVLVQVPTTGAEEPTYMLVSIYALLPALLPPSLRLISPRLFGDIKKNTLSQAGTRRLRRGTRYEQSDGTCVG